VATRGVTGSGEPARAQAVVRGGGGVDVGESGAASGGGDARTPNDLAPQDSSSEIAKAYAPYGIIIAIFCVANSTRSRRRWRRNRSPTCSSAGLHVTNPKGKPLASLTFTFNWLAATGSLMIIAGILTRSSCGLGAPALTAYKDTYVELRWAIVTVMAVLGWRT